MIGKASISQDTLKTLYSQTSLDKELGIDYIIGNYKVRILIYAVILNKDKNGQIKINYPTKIVMLLKRK